MPRSIQEILDHADELARRLEEYEPAEGDERPVEDYLLQRAALARARSERQVVEAVVAARAAGSPGRGSASCSEVGPGRPAALRLPRGAGLTRAHRPSSDSFGCRTPRCRYVWVLGRRRAFGGVCGPIYG